MPDELSIDQEKAVRYLAWTNLKEHEIAEKVGVTRQTLYNWKKIPEFRAAIRAELDAIKNLGRGDRHDQSKKLLRSVMSELDKRILVAVDEGEGLKDMSTKELMSLYKSLNAELRLDEPEEVPEVVDEDQEEEDRLKKRFTDSGAGKPNVAGSGTVTDMKGFENDRSTAAGN